MDSCYGSATIGGFTRFVDIMDVYRDSNGNFATSGGVIDPSTKKIVITVSWDTPYSSSASSTYYVVQTDNTVYNAGSYADFNAGTKTQTQVTDPTDGRVKLANNTKGQWCLPSFSSASISLPDGPPSLLQQNLRSITSSPNKVFAALAPLTTTLRKLAYVNVTANTDPPVPTLKGIFSMDASIYSNASLVPSGTGLDNSFKTNKVSYYKSSSGKTYALLATTKPDKEVIAILVDDNDASNDSTNDKYQDYVNKVFKSGHILIRGFIREILPQHQIKTSLPIQLELLPLRFFRIGDTQYQEDICTYLIYLILTVNRLAADWEHG